MSVKTRLGRLEAKRAEAFMAKLRTMSREELEAVAYGSGSPEEIAQEKARWATLSREELKAIADGKAMPPWMKP